jgi:hypothetical protein
VNVVPEPIPDDRCGNCYCPTESLTRVAGYLVCLDCCEAATGPLWARIQGIAEAEHVYRRSPHSFCMDCGRGEYAEIHIPRAPNTTNLMGGK